MKREIICQACHKTHLKDLLHRSRIQKGATIKDGKYEFNKQEVSIEELSLEGCQTEYMVKFNYHDEYMIIQEGRAKYFLNCDQCAKRVSPYENCSAMSLDKSLEDINSDWVKEYIDISRDFTFLETLSYL
jgi:hypothetical protein